MQKVNYIFVGGCPRSGTTLVQNILDSHQSICGLPEFKNLEEMIYLRRKLIDSVENKLIDVMCSKADVDNRIRSLIDSFLVPFHSEGVLLVSEKTPRNVLVFDELIELYPNAKYIHVVRDPRATISSLQQVGKKAAEKGRKPPYGTVGVRQPIEYLNQCLSAGFKATRNHPALIFTIVYEDLIEKTEEVTKNLCAFLGIAWDFEMLVPGNKKHMGERGITSDEHSIYYTKEKYNRNPEKSDIDKWKKIMSIEDQVRVTQYFSRNKDLERLGYSLNLNYLSKFDLRKAVIKSHIKETVGNLKIKLGAV